MDLNDDLKLELKDVLEYVSISDKNKLKEELEERIETLLGTNTMYWHQIEAVIQKFEPDYEIELLSQQSFKANQYAEAKKAYAQSILYHCYYDILNSMLTDFYDQLDEFLTYANEYFDSDNELDNLSISGECDNCWAVHDSEQMIDDQNIFLWVKKQLDGLNGASVKIYGIWISLTV